MKCNYVKLISRYADNELPAKEKEFLDKHVFACPVCLHELKAITLVKEHISSNKVDTNAEFFWQTLKGRIAKEESALSREESFALDFGTWVKRLIPVPVLASILAGVILLNSNHYNPVDEYLFTNQESGVLELIENAGSQSEISTLLYNKLPVLRPHSA